MKKIFFVFALCSAFFLCTSVASAATSRQFFGVYCANGKTEVDMRSLDQMKSARGGNVYLLQSFTSKMDADNFARKIGSSCPRK